MGDEGRTDYLDDGDYPCVQILSHKVVGLKYTVGGGGRGDRKESGVGERERNGKRGRLWDSDRQSQKLGIATFPS